MARRILAAMAPLLAVLALSVGVPQEARAAVDCADTRPWAPGGVRTILDDGTTLYRLNPALRCGREATAVHFAAPGTSKALRAHRSVRGTWVLRMPSAGPHLHVVAKVEGETSRHGWVRFRMETAR